MAISQPAAPPVVRPQTDRFLIAIMVGIALLIVAGIVTVSILIKPAPLLPADTPSGTVQRFYLALEQEDYDTAYAYLSDSMEHKPTREQFIRQGSWATNRSAQSRIQITSEHINGDNGTVTFATVTLEVRRVYGSGGPFNSGEYTDYETIRLQRENGAWRITSSSTWYWW